MGAERRKGASSKIDTRGHADVKTTSALLATTVSLTAAAANAQLPYGAAGSNLGSGGGTYDIDGYAPNAGNYAPGIYPPGPGGYGPSGGMYAPGVGGYGPGVGYAPGVGGYGPAMGGYAPGVGGYAPGVGGYGPGAGGYAPGVGGYGPGVGGYPLGAGGYPPNLGGYPPQGNGYGPPPAGALDLTAPGSNPGSSPALNDPAFGPNLPRRPAFQSQMVNPGAYSPDIRAHRTMSVRDYGQTFIDPPAPREIMLHDIITVLVDEKSELLVQSRFNRQRNATFNAQLKEFLRIDDDGTLAPAAAEGPSINASLRSRLQSDGSTTDREGIRYRIAATVVGVLPNGNIVLEARKSISSRDGTWEYTLTGTIASRDVKNDYTAISENVANLQIEKNQTGKVSDAAQRPWGMWLYDKLAPF
jgi:flagellar basal body L-ring protein FlgH